MLTALAAEMPGGTVVPVARFRPNIVIAGKWGPGFEDDWIGREVSIGETTRLEITEQTERCVTVTLAQPGVPRDKEVLRVLAKGRNTNFGVYAKVIREGSVRFGDRVRVS